MSESDGYATNLFAQKQMYSFADRLFYEDPTRWTEGVFYLHDADLAVSGSAPPEGWKRRERGAWTVLDPGTELPEQGWKVHVSATLENMDELCSAVWHFCVPLGVPFKHLSSRNMLLVFNAKYAPRGQSGKAITIYPRDETELDTVVTGLSDQLGNAEGPRVLNDLRIGESPVHVRYGAFREMSCLDSNGRSRSAIRRPDGRLVPDLRRASFHVPDWVEVPEFLREHLPRRGAGSAEQPFSVERALHFSNAGGVYVATDRSNGTKVVLKEARAHAALDANHEDAVTRLEREARALEQLEGIKGVPSLHQTFTVADHHFLVQEHLEGTPLHVWSAVHNPWVRTPDPGPDEVKEFTERALALLERLRELVERVHARGLVFGDLQSANVLVDDDDQVGLVDFELAFDITDREWTPGLSTPGYRDRNKRGVDLDRHGLAAVNLCLFLPRATINGLSTAKVPEFTHLVEESFPVPPGWAEAINAELVTGSAALDGDEHGSAPAFGAQEGDLAPARDSMAEAISLSATPDRRDRLYPGEPEQFIHGGLGLFHGAAGVLWALRTAGQEISSAHGAWLLERSAESGVPEPGLMHGAAGVALALDALGHGAAATDVLDRGLGSLDERSLGSDLGAGLAGIAGVLLQLGRNQEQPELRRRGIEYSYRLAEAVRTGRFHPRPGAEKSSSEVPAGLAQGWSGPALVLARAFDEEGDEEFRRAAFRAVHRDLDACTRTAAGLLVYEEPGRRMLPYLDVGSTGIALAADEILRMGEDERLTECMPALCRATRLWGTVQGGLMRGRAGMLAASARLGARGWPVGDVATQVRALSTYAVPYRHQAAFPGTTNSRLSMDLASGTAGVLLSATAAERPGIPFFPLLPPREQS